MKVEAHCHIFGGSRCAKADDDYVLSAYKNAGYDGIVVTNHYTPVCSIAYQGTNHEEKVNYWFNLIDSFREKAKNYGIKIFYAGEVDLIKEDGFRTEFMVIGLTKEFLLKHDKIATYNQQKLFELCEENGFFMYQTHPFRKGVKVADPRFMHGAEAFNGHFHHDNNNALAVKFCEENKLVKLSGSDFHDYGQRPLGGLILPEIKNEKEYINALLKNNYSLIVNEEEYINDRKTYLNSLK